jgi:hypothetical protein
MTNTLELGDLQADFMTEGGELTAQVKDLGGPLSADGSFVLENSGKYKVKLALVASDPANSGLQQTLRMAGKQASDGKVYVEISDTYQMPQGLTIR